MAALNNNPRTDGGNIPTIYFPNRSEQRSLNVLVWPHPALTEPAIPVSKLFSLHFGSEELEQLIVDMLHTMRRQNGIGLAAPQVSVPYSVITLEVEPGKPYYFINPIILFEDTNNAYEWEEGCLSVPGYFEVRSRPAQIIVDTADVNGDNHTVTLQGLYAFALQHEIDHLNGKVFVDELSDLKKGRIRTKIKKTLRQRLQF